MYIDNLKSLFLVLTGSAGGKLKEKLVDEQEIVMNLADILSMAFIAESAFLRVKKLSEKNGTDKAALQIKTKLAQLYLYDALDTARKAAHNAIDSFASGLTKVMLKWVVRTMLSTYTINPKALRREAADYIIEKRGYYF
jgi:hypothetical protein